MPRVISLRDRFVNYVHSLQDTICEQLEELDGRARFHEDKWQREEGGGGIARVISGGKVFEKGGVNTSVVYGNVSEALQKHMKTGPGWFFATGISLVIHPANPMVPTVHANFRYFELRDDGEHGPIRDAWFGGGTDLTPWYLWEDDAQHFHTVLASASDEYDEKFYPTFKAWCDRYFYLPHRKETRGIGGMFFDWLREEEGYTLEDRFEFVTGIGDAFLDAYTPIVERRAGEPFDERHRYWQEIRRGRYAEFNLLHDRGTQFGLQSGGRTESILMSLPPRVRWDYNFQPEAGTREAFLVSVLKNPREWAIREEEEDEDY